MKIQVGYEIDYQFPQSTPLILLVNIHHSRTSDLVIPDHLVTDPQIPTSTYHDSFGNWCTRLVAPPGLMRLTGNGVVRDSGEPETIDRTARQIAVQDLPSDTLVFLLGSRYCETELLSQIAWNLFGQYTPGWQRVQAICDFVHNHITFGYGNARPTKTAWEAYNERAGVCRDYAHLAITFCRAMNIPARYCTGYLSDVGVPPPYSPMDFAAWFEVYLGGRWHATTRRGSDAC
jgi:transglutaminase-like putative cysteine protease